METQIEIFATSHGKRSITAHLVVTRTGETSDRSAVVAAANKFAHYATKLRSLKGASGSGWSLTAPHTIRVEVDGRKVFNSQDVNLTAVWGGDVKRAWTTSAVVTEQSIRASIVSAFDYWSLICDDTEVL
jgi:hypothetical protein